MTILTALLALVLSIFPVPKQESSWITLEEGIVLTIKNWIVCKDKQSILSFARAGTTSYEAVIETLLLLQYPLYPGGPKCLTVKNIQVKFLQERQQGFPGFWLPDRSQGTVYAYQLQKDGITFYALLPFSVRENTQKLLQGKRPKSRVRPPGIDI